MVLGSSGVGKSTLVNHLAQADIQDMMQARTFDDKGRHCTTFRHLVKTPSGGLIIDTPGLRGLTLGEATDGLPPPSRTLNPSPPHANSPMLATDPNPARHQSRPRNGTSSPRTPRRLSALHREAATMADAKTASRPQAAENRKTLRRHQSPKIPQPHRNAILNHALRVGGRTRSRHSHVHRIIVSDLVGSL